MKSSLIRFVFPLLLLALSATAQSQDTAGKPRATKPKQAISTTGRELEADQIEVYKTIDGAELKAFIFLPEDHQATDHRAATVFFFGGGWTNGSPGQFVEHCKHLASRGMVAITADYRVASRQGVKAVSCVTDAKSAIRWTRQNAAKLGIDPNRIVAGGGSAGGHIAACTGVIDGFDEPGEDATISSKPNAMALFNPALVLAEIEGETESDAKRLADLAARMGIEPQRLSPIHHVGANEPPTIIFHGKADTTVPYVTAEKFAAAMQAEGNECELVGYEGQSHGFFNFGRGDGKGYKETIAKLDSFLEQLGYVGDRK